MYHLIYYSAYLFSLLPLRVLYVFADFAYLIIYYIVGYRKQVVRKNLRNSFPEKSAAELRKIEKGFYHWFCDYVFETIKLTTMSKKEMSRRMRFENMEEVEETLKKNPSISFYLGHYCNWEWVSSMSAQFPEGVVCGQIYHQLESDAADRFFLKIRGRFGSVSIKMEDTLSVIRGWNREKKPNVVGYISDQVPGFHGMHYWPIFLNQKTPTYSGAERISRLFNTAAFYIDINRVKRGYYVARMVKICDEARKEENFFLTARYFELLEQTIKARPECWLWSHNRWKRTWEDFCREYPDEQKRNAILAKP